MVIDTHSVTIQVPTGYFKCNSKRDPFRVGPYVNYLTAREWRLNVKAGRVYHDYTHKVSEATPISETP
jgi:hypothetical protein